MYCIETVYLIMHNGTCRKFITTFLQLYINVVTELLINTFKSVEDEQLVNE